MKTREGIYRLVLKNIPVLLFVIVFIIFGIFSPKFLSLASFSNIILNEAVKNPVSMESKTF